jgi:hypothetical protein
MFNREFLREKGLPEPTWFETTLPDHVEAAVARAKASEE